MQYINKYHNSKEAHSLISGFLRSLWVRFRYLPKDLYERFKGERITVGHREKMLKWEFEKILLREQRGRCCYCMRELKRGTITLEHIIPNRVKSIEEFNEYLTYDTILKEKVVFTPDYELDGSYDKITKFPHSVAYENLAASCDGKVHSGTSKKSHNCNLYRQDRFIPPIMLIEGIDKRILYYSNGFVRYLDDDDQNTIINRLGLNDVNLRLIRRIWSRAKKNYTIQTMYEAKNRQQIRNQIVNSLTLYVSNEELYYLYNFKRFDYWCLLLEYRYFFYTKFL